MNCFLTVFLLIPDDGRSEIFCHDPLTGDILRSEVTSGGQFQQQTLFKAGFCSASDIIINQSKSRLNEIWN